MNNSSKKWKFAYLTIIFIISIMVIPNTCKAVDTPTLLTPSNGVKINDPTPIFCWSITGGSADFSNLQVAFDSGFTNIIIAITAPITSYTNSSDLADDLYFWRVRARDDTTYLWSDWSDTWSFSIDTNPPGTPLLQSPGYDDYVNTNDPLYDWNSVPFGYLYNIEVATDTSFLSKIIDTNTVNTYYDGINLTEGGPYYWRVSARDEAGNWGLPSPYATFYVDTVAPDWPESIYPHPSAYHGSEPLTFIWEEFHPTESHFQFQLGYDVFFSSMYLDVEVDQNNYTHQFASEVKYYWRVRARDLAENWGDWGTVRSVTIDTTLPLIDSPPNVQYTVGSIGNNITWNAEDLNAINYTLYKDGVFYSNDTWITGIPIVIDIDGLAVGSYNFTIVVVDRAGNTMTDTVLVDVLQVIKEFNRINYLFICSLVFIPILFRIRRKSR